MKDSVCPKCNASEIYSNVNIKRIGSNRLFVDVWTGEVPLNVYMCRNCGYIEYYVAKQGSRQDSEEVDGGRVGS